MTKKLRVFMCICLLAAAGGMLLSAFVNSNNIELKHPVYNPVPSTVATQDMPDNVDEVIRWNTKVKQNGCEATLIIEVTQLNGWHIYSQMLPDGAINQPTEFTWKANDGYALKGKTQEPESHEIDNEGFPERPLHGELVVFKQKIDVKSKSDFKVSVDVEFMACLDMCFPPTTRTFTFNVKGCSSGEVEEVANDETDGDDEEESEGDTTERADSLETITSPIGWQGMAWKLGDGKYELVYTPQIPEGWKIVSHQIKNPADLKIENGQFKIEGDLTYPKFESKPDSILGQDVLTYLNGSFIQKIKINPADTNQVVHAKIQFAAVSDEGELIYTEEAVEVDLELAKAAEKSDNTEGKKSYWTIFWLAFGGGLLALLTPCVFPMIPLTVSFFTKGAEDKKKGLFRGITYGVFIFAIYVLLSVPFHVLDKLNPNILNEIATNVPLNIFFFVMLTVFAMSFLGAFEITLPSKWTSKADSASNVGGVVGIFFMALTLAIVSFSCTGPILGSLLAGAQQVGGGGGAWQLTAGMAGFGVALGLPFALFAIFPSWLNSLPQSGGWLNSVKVVLGFLELAFAFKFLSNADMGLNAHMLERELFIAIWIAIFGAMTLYLFNVYRTSHDSPVESLSTFRLVVAVLSLMFTVYLLPGLWGAPLKLVSAFPPPLSYSESPHGFHGHTDAMEGENEFCDGAEFEHGMWIFKDYYEALECAKEKNLPLLIDFTGIQCVNCRKMEANVWTDEEVHHLMSEEFVVVSLYVDDYETPLPKPETSPYSGKKLGSYGDKWGDMQISLYKKSSQPQYIMLDNNEQQMKTDATYRSHGSPAEFKKWLESGLEEFKIREEVKTIYGEVVKVQLK